MDKNSTVVAESTTRADMNGQFEVSARRLGQWNALYAEEERSAGDVAPCPARGSVISVDPSVLSSPFHITLVPQAGISGQCVDSAGNPTSGLLRAVPTGSHFLREETTDGMIATAKSDRAGVFDFQCLAQGKYDLWILHKQDKPYDFPIGEHYLGTFSTGTAGVILNVPEGERTDISLDLSNATVPVAKVQIVHGRLWPFHGVRPYPGLTAALGESSEPWPAVMSLNHQGLVRTMTADGYLSLGSFQRAFESRIELPRMMPGIGCIGVVPMSDKNEPYYPVWSGMVNLPPGSISITVPVIEVGRINGHVTVPLDDGLQVFVLTPSGATIPVATKESRFQLVPSKQIEPDGNFQLTCVPVGPVDVGVWPLEIGPPHSPLFKKHIIVQAGVEANISLP